MKILLFGEFSGLHNNLKDGLIELGHEVVLASGRDGYKMIPNDLNLDGRLSGIIGKLETRVRPFIHLPKLVGYDVFQSINPFYPNAKYFPKLQFYKMLKLGNKKFYMLGAGSDAYFWKCGRKCLKYGPFEDFLKYDHGVIPVMYEYEKSYSDCNKLKNTIPLPVNTNNIEYNENVTEGKLVVFHGLSRYGFKGTRHVEEAFEILRKKYPNDLELIINGKMPFDDYIKLLRRANVVVDQVYSHSLGMNGVYALAMGKVVLGGVEPEGLESLSLTSSPAINVRPEANSIIKEIEWLLDNRSKITEIGKESRMFAERVHGHIKVAKKYIETWSAS